MNTYEYFQDVRVLHQDSDELKKKFESEGIEGCRRFLTEKRQEWKTVPLDIAVIGHSGVGKSTFINAMMRMTAEDEGAAPVGSTETTTEIKKYAHPDKPMLNFWDLPGVGTPRFPKDEYLEAIDVKKYDFFLLMSATRFTENDIWLGKEIENIGRKYYYVRTKIGADISGNKKAYPTKHSEEGVLTQIRQGTISRLRENDCNEARVFLIDSYKPQKFDFEQLEESLVTDFPRGNGRH